MFPVLVRVAVTACCLVFSGPIWSAESSEGALTLRLAVDRALQQQPALAGFVFELRAQEAHVAEAGLKPPLQGEVLVEDALGSGARSGLSTAQTTLSLSRLIELGGKRDGRIAVAEATRDRLRTEQAARQLDVLAEVTRRFLGVLNWQARSDVAAEGVVIATRALDAVQRRVAAARAPEVEALRAEVSLIEAELGVEDAEHELETARHFLAAAMGETDSRFDRAAGTLLELPPATPLATLLGRLERSPDFLRFADEGRLRDAELRLVEMRRRPDIRGTIGARRYEQGDDFALIAGVTVPFSSARRAEAQIDAARAQRERLGTERQTAFLKAQARLFDQYQALEHARHESRLLREEIIPRLEKALGQTEYAYQQGRYSFLEWTTAQRNLLDARRRQIDVATDFHILLTEIERLTGEGLDTTGEPR